MKLNPNFILRELAGESLLVSIVEGEETKRLLYLNEIGKDIFLLLQEGKQGDALIDALLELYDIDEATLRTDTDAFLQTLQTHGVVVD